MEQFQKLKKKISVSKIPDNLNDGLETLAEYKLRWRSIRIIYFTMFLISLGFSIVLTGIWPFLDQLDPTAGKEFMGLIVSANPLGQMLFSPLFGYWGNKSSSIRNPLLISLALFTLGSSIYSCLEFIPNYTKYWMLGSRFLVGISSANVAVCRSYISAATRISERTFAVSMVSLAQVLGFIVGPGVQAAVTPLGINGITVIHGIFKLNMYTAAGWLNVVMGIANFCLFLPVLFQDRNIAAKEVMKTEGMSTEKETWQYKKPDQLSVWTLIVSFFALVFNFVLLETLGTSLTMDQFAWSKTEALYYMGILMSVGAIIACITFVAIGPLCKLFVEHNVLIWGGFFLMLVSQLICIPWGDSPPKIAEVYNSNNNGTSENDEKYLGCPQIQTWCEYTPALTITQFVISYSIISVGYPIGVTLIQTLFSKILGTRPQGLWMGLMTGSGCLSRVLGPVFVGFIYTRLGTYWTFGFTSILILITMTWILIFRNRLIPPKYEKAIEMQEMLQNKLEEITEGSEQRNAKVVRN